MVNQDAAQYWRDQELMLIGHQGVERMLCEMYSYSECICI